jgi:uncharacterized protein
LLQKKKHNELQTQRWQKPNGKWQMAKFSITTAFGIPSISTETPINLDGFKPQVDMLKWIVEKATHSYSTSGLTMQLELEASL